MSGWSYAEAAANRCDNPDASRALVNLWQKGCEDKGRTNTLYLRSCDEQGTISQVKVCDSYLIQAPPGITVYGAPPPQGSSAWKILHGATSPGDLFSYQGWGSFLLILIAIALFLFGTRSRRKVDSVVKPVEPVN